jgi:hypothetical protein
MRKKKKGNQGKINCAKRKLPLIDVCSLAERRSRERSEKRKGKTKAWREENLFLLSIWGFHALIPLPVVLNLDYKLYVPRITERVFDFFALLTKRILFLHFSFPYYSKEEKLAHSISLFLNTMTL